VRPTSWAFSKTPTCAQSMLREWQLCPKTSNLRDASEENEPKFKPAKGPYQGQHFYLRGNFILDGIFFIPVGEFNSLLWYRALIRHIGYCLGSANGVCHGLATFSNLRLVFPSLWQYRHFIHTSIFVHWIVDNLRLVFPVLCLANPAFREIVFDNLIHTFSPAPLALLNPFDVYIVSAGSEWILFCQHFKM